MPDTRTDSVHVRRAGLGDVDGVTGLFLAYLAFYGRPAPADEVHAYLTARMSRGESVVLVARLDGVPGLAGFAQMYPTFSSLSMSPVWTVNDLFVAPAARRRGVAAALLAATAADAEAAGVTALELATAVENTVARALYESLGFRLDADFVHYARRLRS